MKRTSPLPEARSQSIWAETASLPKGSKLSASLTTDVCIVGAGIAGLSTAYLLARSGRRVVVVDDGPLAGGMTQVTTAHLSNAIDDRLFNIERWHGAEGLRLAAQSHAAAIDRIEAIADELGVDCDFRRVDGYLFLAPVHHRKLLQDEYDAARRAGLDVELLERAPTEGFNSGPCLRFPQQGRVHIYKYLSAVAKAIEKLGGRLFTGAHVDGIEGGEQAKIQAGDYVVTADAVVVATNSPINDRVAIHTKQAPYMTYAIGVRVPRGSVGDALYWDTLEAYHYIRLQELPADHGGDEFDLLIVGGEDHKTGQADDADQRHARLEAWTREHFPSAEEVAFTWGGQVQETIDGLAFIGRNPMDADNVYIATGDSGMGVTHGTIAGMLLADLILGRDNPWAKLYEPSRKTLRAAGSFAKENLNVVMQYADLLTGGEVESADDIPRGQGAVLRRGMSKIAASRDEHGNLTELSAICPHLSCVVHWNNAEQTWDCPCHGSRFHADGEVVCGPANTNLPPAEK